MNRFSNEKDGISAYKKAHNMKFKFYDTYRKIENFVRRIIAINSRSFEFHSLCEKIGFKSALESQQLFQQNIPIIFYL